ncbi:hypothetical protein EJB05_47626, partial [Eragrostis curvula]
MAIVDLASSAEDRLLLHEASVGNKRSVAEPPEEESAAAASTMVGYGKHEGAAAESDRSRREEQEAYCVKGVRHLSDSGITRLPHSYVMPPSDRPLMTDDDGDHLRLPVIDLARLRDPGQRAAVLQTLDAACRDYGFFQVVNHGVGREVSGGVLDAARRFFELPFAERARYMTSDVRTTVRYGTSFNQAKDAVLCWRDFLKLVCQPNHHRRQEVVPEWPAGVRDAASRYAMANHALFLELMDALLQALLGISSGGGLVGELASASSQMMTINCYPACPEPELTLGMPPHSDYGLLTLLLQDHVEGLQVMHRGRWLTVQPAPGSFAVNVGDHLEIYSNGRYKSVLHRVRVNSTRPRISVASFHSVPAERTIGPAPELVDGDHNPPRYMDTDFATFLAYIATAEGKHKTFLQSRKLPLPSSS